MGGNDTVVYAIINIPGFLKGSERPRAHHAQFARGEREGAGAVEAAGDDATSSGDRTVDQTVPSGGLRVGVGTEGGREG